MSHKIIILPMVLIIVCLQLYSVGKTQKLIDTKTKQFKKTIDEYDNNLTSFTHYYIALKIKNEQLFSRLINLRKKYDKFNLDEVVENLMVDLKDDIPKEDLEEYKNAFNKYSIDHGFFPQLPVIIAYYESKFKPDVEGPNIWYGDELIKCQGTMQIHPKAHRDKLKLLGIKDYEELREIPNNIQVGMWILNDIYKRCDNDLICTLTGYVGGDVDHYINGVYSDYQDRIIEMYGPELLDIINSNPRYTNQIKSKFVYHLTKKYKEYEDE